MHLLVAFLLAAAPADPARAELDQLLTALAQAPSETIATRMEARITELWLKSGGPAATLLINRGIRTLQAGEAAEAVDDFDAALTLAPGLPEAFARRAMARYHAGDVAGALRDLEEAVRTEPRDFSAWRALSAIAEAQGNFPGALSAWQKLLEIDPKTEGAAKRLHDLTVKVEGEAL